MIPRLQDLAAYGSCRGYDHVPVSCVGLQVMTKIGAICLITIGCWVVIELGVQFGAYSHSCYTGVGA